eukprot:3510189-Rhodomonas_salina.1
MPGTDIGYRASMMHGIATPVQNSRPKTFLLFLLQELCTGVCCSVARLRQSASNCAARALPFRLRAERAAQDQT